MKIFDMSGKLLKTTFLITRVHCIHFFDIESINIWVKKFDLISLPTKKQPNLNLNKVMLPSLGIRNPLWKNKIA